MTYTQKDLIIRSELAHVRHRPSMYLGSLDEKGLAYALSDVLKALTDPSISIEGKNLIIAAKGPSSTAYPKLFSPEEHPKVKKPIIEINFSIIPCGRPDGPLHWPWALAVINAVSEHLVIETAHDGKRYKLEFSRGVLIHPCHEIPVDPNLPSIRLSIEPDCCQIFKSMDLKILVKLLQDRGS